MKNAIPGLVVVVPFTFALGCLAEATEPDEGPGRTSSAGVQNGGGSANAGGSTTVGGQVSAAGSTSVSGSSSAAGTTTGGNGAGGTATGGTTSAGGTETGGTIGTAGTTTAGGSSTTGGSGGFNGVIEYPFASDLEGFTVRPGSTPPALEAGTTTLWDATSGDPSLGAAELTIPFTAPDQKVQFALNFPSANLKGRTVSVRVQLVSGPAADEQGGAGVKVYVKSGASYVYADGGYTAIPTLGAWKTATVKVDAPAYTDTAAGTFDGTDIREIGVEIATGSDGTYAEGVILIDSIDY